MSLFRQHVCKYDGHQESNLLQALIQYHMLRVAKPEDRLAIRIFSSAACNELSELRQTTSPCIYPNNLFIKFRKLLLKASAFSVKLISIIHAMYKPEVVFVFTQQLLASRHENSGNFKKDKNKAPHWHNFNFLQYKDFCAQFTTKYSIPVPITQTSNNETLVALENRCLFPLSYLSIPYPAGRWWEDLRELMMQPSRPELFYLTASFKIYILYLTRWMGRPVTAVTKPLATWRNSIFIVRGDAVRIATNKKLMAEIVKRYLLWCVKTRNDNTEYSAELLFEEILPIQTFNKIRFTQKLLLLHRNHAKCIGSRSTI